MNIVKKYPNIQKRKDGKATYRQRWSLKNIRDGFLYFYDLHNHYPVAYEIDDFNYLPSARSIQRTHGGLRMVRKKLSIGEEDYACGDFRAIQASKADKRALLYEMEFYNFLISRVPEVRVHEHKIIRPGNINSDFFIYTTDKFGIVLDLFYARDIRILGGIINIKLKRYININYQTFFILVGNDSIPQFKIDLLVKNRKNKLPPHIKVVTEDYFKINFQSIIDKYK